MNNVSLNLFDRVQCFEIIPSKYLPVSYRFNPNDNWVGIPNAVRYELDNNKGKCDGIEYDVTVNFWIRANNDCSFVLDVTRPYRMTGGNFRLRHQFFVSDNIPWDCGIWSGFTADRGRMQLLSDTQIRTLAANTPYIGFFSFEDNVSSARILDIQRVDGLPDNCRPCELRAYDIDDNLIFQQQWETCPEVRDAGCEDNTPICLTLEIPFLGQVLASNIYFNADQSETQDIPEECMIVYRLIPSVPIGGGLSSTGIPIWEYIEMYCSDEGCSRPKLKNIECGTCSDIENVCPNNTCAVICGSVICCYDNQGFAIKTIPL